MNSLSLKKRLKKHPLLLAIAFSAAVHLVAFYFSPSFSTLPQPDKGKVIRIKAVVEKKAKPLEKGRTLVKRNVARKSTPAAETPDNYAPKPRPKSDIIEHVKAVTNGPSPVSTRNPVPTRNLTETFKPVNPVQSNTSAPPLVSAVTAHESFVMPDILQPVPRKNRAVSRNPEMHLAVAREAYPLKTLNDSTKATITASSKWSGERFAQQTTVIQKRQPLEFDQTSLASPPVSLASNLGPANNSRPFKTLQAKSPQTFNEPETAILAKREIVGSTIQHQQRAEVQVRAPENLHLESTALHQPTMPVYANYFSSPLKSANLFKEAAIPSGFSEETLKSGNEDQEASAKIANLSVGIDVISEEGLKKIKNGFSTQVRTKIAKVKYYPRIARNRGFEGQPVIAFTLGSKGELLDLSIAAPSPFKLLDEAALNAIKSASPYPPIPAPLKLKSMKFKIPISFNLEER